MTRTTIGSISFPWSLGLTLAPLATVSGLGSDWNIGINGKGYLLSTLGDESPFEYRALTIRGRRSAVPRIDTSEEPGEQSLGLWWPRAQHSWHLGSGQKIFDSPESSRFKFLTSKGLDPWTIGKIKLHKRAFTMDSGAFSDYLLLAAGGFLFEGEDGLVWKVTNIDTHPTGSTSSTVGGPAGAGTTFVKSMTSDGKFLYVCWDPTDNHGVRRQDMTTWTGNTLVNDLDPDLIQFVKGRLLAAKTRSLYDLVLGVTTAPSPFFTHVSEGWVWTGITATGPAIYCSGFAGESSAIYSIGLDATVLASGVTLGSPVEAWKAPDGEVIHSIYGYLSKALLIGTSKGVRLGMVVNVEGDLDVSGLIVETPMPVKAFEPQGDYAWFGWGKFDSTESGLGRLHLGTLAYASDLMASVQGNIQSIAQINNRTIFSTMDVGTNVVAAEHATELAASGYFETGEIRFGTFEQKHIHFIDALLTGTGTFDLDIKKDQASAFVSSLSGHELGTVLEGLNISGSRFNAKFTLNRDSGDATKGPEMLEWRFRAEPHPEVQLEFEIPILTYDFVTTLSGVRVGSSGESNTIRNDLLSLYHGGIEFLLELTNLDPVRVRIDEMEFKSFTPPKGADGLGGITLLLLREQE